MEQKMQRQDSPPADRLLRTVFAVGLGLLAACKAGASSSDADSRLGVHDGGQESGPVSDGADFQPGGLDSRLGDGRVPDGCRAERCGSGVKDAGSTDQRQDSGLPVITGTTYYVSPTGLDTNPGSKALPWRTIQKAATTMVAGDGVQILAGTYREKVTPLNSGSAGKAIVYLGAAGTAILDGAGVSLGSSGYGEGLLQLVGKSHLRIQGLTIKNAAVHGVNLRPSDSGTPATHIEIVGNTILNTRTVGIKAHRAQHVTVKDNVIKHVLYSSGIGVWNSEHVLVERNSIDTPHWYHECQGAHEEALTISNVNHFEVAWNTVDYTEAPPAGYCTNAQRLGIDVKESSQDGLVHHNTVRNMDAAGIYVDGWHAGANGTPTLNHVKIYQNKVTDGGGITVGCEQADGVVEFIDITNNLVINASFSGIQVRGAHGDGLRRNIHIENNTVYGALPAGGNGGAGIYVTTAHLGSNNGEKPVVIRNNISNFYFLSSGGGTVGQIRAGTAAQAAHVQADHNLVYGPQSCSTEYPSCVELGSRISAAPSALYLDASALDLHLRSGAPAIDAGATIGSIVDDHDGVPRPRPAGGAYDIGAYERR